MPRKARATQEYVYDVRFNNGDHIILKAKTVKELMKLLREAEKTRKVMAIQMKGL